MKKWFLLPVILLILTPILASESAASIPSEGPDLLYPKEGWTGNDNTPRFEWGGVENAANYRLQIDDDPEFGSPEYDNSSLTENFDDFESHPENALLGGTYWWRVAAENGENRSWSDTREFKIDTDPPAAPSPLHPEDGTITNDVSPNLKWNAVDDPSPPVQYRCWVDDDSDFSSVESDSGWIEDDNFQITLELDYNIWYWRVQARDDAGNRGENSGIYSLTLDPSMPSLASPSDGTVTNDDLLTFEWENEVSVDKFELWIDDDDDFGSPTVLENTTDNCYTLSPDDIPSKDALPDEKYSWRVRSFDGSENGHFSDRWTFTVDTGGPSAPPSSPDDGLVTNDRTPTINWDAASDTTGADPGDEAGIKHYEIWVDDDPGFTSTRVREGLSGTSWTPRTQLPEDNYSFKVRAWDWALSSEFGEATSSLSFPDNRPTGLAWDGQNLWMCADGADSVHGFEVDGTITSSFESPDQWPSGLAWDGQNLWLAGNSSDNIFKLDSGGDVLETIDWPYNDPGGLAWDGEHLWVSVPAKDRIYELSTSGGGNVLSSFKFPGTSPRGLAWCGTHLWCVDGIEGKIYELSTSGGVISSIDSHGEDPGGLAWDGENLWQGDYDDDEVYRIDAGQGNAGSFSSTWTFRVDATPPSISGVDEFGVGERSARIEWTTDEPADSVLEYGENTQYGTTISDGTLVTEHSVTLENLSEDTTYHYRVKSSDGAGNSSSSTDMKFTTLALKDPKSSVEDLDGYWQSSVPFPIKASASDEDGRVENVELHYRYRRRTSGDWGSWRSFGVDGGSPWKWSFDAPENDGHYEFYTQAKDNDDQVESAPKSADENAGVDTAAPTLSRVWIDGDNRVTNLLGVTLSILAEDSIAGLGRMRFSEDEEEWTSWEPFKEEVEYELSPPAGTKTVHVQVRDRAGLVSRVLEDSILLENIIFVRRMGTISESGAKLVDFSGCGVPVRGVMVYTRINVSGAQVRVQVLNSRPGEITAEEPGNVSYYFYLKSDIPREDLSRVEIEFEVRRSWLEELNSGPEGVRLWRLDGSWQSIPISKVGENATHIIYSATLTDLSWFAVTAKEGRGGIGTLGLLGLVVPSAAVAILTALIGWRRVESEGRMPDRDGLPRRRREGERVRVIRMARPSSGGLPRKED